jgi:hypothetical protein
MIGAVVKVARRATPARQMPRNLMPTLRFGFLRPTSIALLVMAVTACGSGAGASTPVAGGPPSSAPTDSATMATRTATAPTTTAAAPSAAVVVPSGGSSECQLGATGGHARYTIGGYEAWHMCGPATATVTLGGTTAHISSGSCSVPAPGTYDVAIGTQVFGDAPASLEPDFLNIYIVSADGLADPGGVVSHTGWLLIGARVTFGPNKMSGTFSGPTINPGTTVTGSFTCQ